jgi:hypothetical protein
MYVFLLTMEWEIRSLTRLPYAKMLLSRFWLFENEGIVGPFPSAIGQLANLSEFLGIFHGPFFML